MRFAGAYRRANLIVIHGNAKTLPGFLIHSPPWIALPDDAGNAAIGEAVRTALAAYREDEPAPDYRSADWKELRRAGYRAAGARSERAYMTESTYVSLCEENGILRLAPTRNGGTRGDGKGFQFLPSAELRAQPCADSEVIGRAVREAWGRCT